MRVSLSIYSTWIENIVFVFSFQTICRLAQQGFQCKCNILVHGKAFAGYFLWNDGVLRIDRYIGRMRPLVHHVHERLLDEHRGHHAHAQFQKRGTWLSKSQVGITRAVSQCRARWNPIGMSKPSCAKTSVLEVYRFSARIFSTQERRTMSFTETATRSQSANGREAAHYVWQSPTPSANPTVVSIIATTTSTLVAMEKNIIIKLGKM